MHSVSLFSLSTSDRYIRCANGNRQQSLPDHNKQLVYNNKLVFRGHVETESDKEQACYRAGDLSRKEKVPELSTDSLQQHKPRTSDVATVHCGRICSVTTDCRAGIINKRVERERE